MRCDEFRNLMLDHLYGLLDESDAAAINTHLTGCDACTTARVAAAHAQGLLARAAKSSFPGVRFVPPDQAVTVDLAVPSERTRGAVSPRANGTPARPPRKALAGVSWGRWVVAASLLVLIPAAVLPVSGWASRFDVARRTFERTNTEYADARSAFDRANGEYARKQATVQGALAAAKQRHDALLNDWATADKEAAQRAAANRIDVRVDRPAALQPGAPNEFVLTVLGTGRDVVEADIRDQDGMVLVHQTIDHEKNGDTHKLRLPAEVWSRVGPHSELFLTVARIDEKTGARTELQDKLRLFGPVYTTLLVTDKPMYRPGERLFFRSLTLDRVSFRPPAQEQLLRYELRKIDNKADGTPVPGLAVAGSAEPVRVTEAGVDPVFGPDGKPVRGVGCGSFALPAGLADGDYVLTLTEQRQPAGYASTLAAPVKRTVRVRSGAVEQYQKKIGFAAAAYSAGEVVEAWCELKLNDKPVPNVPVDVVVIANGVNLPAQVVPIRTKADGRVGVMFELPANLGRGEIELLAKFKLQNREEQVRERVPLAGRDLVVEFFPEGGELVAGVPGRVYVRATNTTGMAVDVRGSVTDGKNALARVETRTDPKEPGANRGLGVFTITPQLGTTYTLKLDHPANVATAFPLPAPRNEGVVMTVPDGVTAPGEAVRVQLHSVGKPRNLVVGAYTRGRLADTKRVTVQPNTPAEVKLLTGDDPRGGVTRITVFEDPNANPADPQQEWKPVAERLVFRKPGEKLNLAFAAKNTDGPAPFGPGSPVELTINATDEKGRPVAAIVWASVVNEAVVSRPQDRLMPTHFLLAGETESPDALEYADFLLTDHARAAEALDMVLATQGWRRFVEQKPPAVNDKDVRLEVAQLLALNGQLPTGAEASQTRKSRELFEAFWPQVEAAGRALDAARTASAVPIDTRPVDEAKKLTTTRCGDACTACDAAKAAAAPLRSLSKWVWFAVVGFVGFGAVMAGVACFKPNGLGGVLPMAIAAVAALGLAGFFGVTAAELEPDADIAHVDKFAPAEIVTPDVKAHAKTNVQAMTPEVVPMVTPKVVVIPPAIRSPGVFPPHPLLIDRGQKMVPQDARWDGRDPARDPGVRMHVTQTLASDAAEDPARRAADQSAAGRAADFEHKIDEAVPPLDAAAVERVRAAIPRMAPLVVREYAARRPGPPAETESDTVLWQPLIVLPTDGKTTTTFHLGTGVAGYRVMIAGHTLDGRIGAVSRLLPVAPAAKTAPPPPVGR